MRIIRASVMGFMGIDRADIRLGHVNVFYGKNGIGKSSILEAILLPIFGVTPRQARKKDWSHMIRSPASRAELFIQVEEEVDGARMMHDLSGRINLKSNSIKGLKTPDLFDQVLLNPLAFFDLPAKVKADLAGDVKLDPRAVAERIASFGVDLKIQPEVSRIILEYRLTGAEKELERRRLQKSRDAVEPGEEPKLYYAQQEMSGNITQDQMREYRNNVAQWEQLAASIDERIRAASAIPSQQAYRDQLRAEALKVLNKINVPDNFPRQLEWDQVNQRLADMTQKRAQLANSLIHEQEPCKVCGRPYNPNQLQLQRRIDDLDSTIIEEQSTLKKLSLERDGWLQRHNDQRVAKERLETLDELPELPEVDIEQLKLEAQKAREGAQQCRDWLQTVERFMLERELWQRRKTAYETAKTERALWDHAVKVVRNPEFKSSLVSDPIQKARDRLNVTGEFVRMKVYVSDELEVTVNGRPWWLLSTAQKLQASTLLADAFAHAGGSRILVIDGVDTLVGTAQQQLLQFLNLIKSDYDTILLALAIEDADPPAYELSDPPFANWYWVRTEEEGVIVTFRKEA